jgi:hypothetical protein
MARVDLNKYIKKSHITALEKFKAELEQYKTECDPDGLLYEDANTSFTLSDIHLMDGCLCYTYDGKDDHDTLVNKDPDTGEYYEIDGPDSLMGIIKFWRKCLNRARKFWRMDPEHLDAIQNAEVEYHEEEEE